MYEWDENKNFVNLAKHGVDFNVACDVFSDPYAIVHYNRTINNEIRDQIIGKINNEIVILFVVFTKRKNIIRIISARKASSRERAIYNHHNEKI